MDYDKIKSATGEDGMKRWIFVAILACIFDVLIVVIAGGICWKTGSADMGTITVVVCAASLLFLLFLNMACIARKNYLTCWRLREAYTHKQSVLRIAAGLQLATAKDVLNCSVDANEQVEWMDAVQCLLMRLSGKPNGSEQSHQVGEDLQKVSDNISGNGTPQVVVNNQYVGNGGCPVSCMNAGGNVHLDIQQILSALPKPDVRLRADYKLAENVIEMLADDPSKRMFE